MGRQRGFGRRGRGRPGLGRCRPSALLASTLLARADQRGAAVAEVDGRAGAVRAAELDAHPVVRLEARHAVEVGVRLRVGKNQASRAPDLLPPRHHATEELLPGRHAARSMLRLHVHAPHDAKLDAPLPGRVVGAGPIPYLAGRTADHIPGGIASHVSFVFEPRPRVVDEGSSALMEVRRQFRLRHAGRQKRRAPVLLHQIVVRASRRGVHRNVPRSCGVAPAIPALEVEQHHLAVTKAQPSVHTTCLVRRAQQHAAVAVDGAPVLDHRAHQLGGHAAPSPLFLHEHAPDRPDLLILDNVGKC
mmetsp:Transcript_7230/g.23798  ORF Transcript_7230/g.23798 Transcript_7230/m.23798 type:complete len:303 (+) Transcript_7230:1102-2010(+)